MNQNIENNNNYALNNNINNTIKDKKNNKIKLFGLVISFINVIICLGVILILTISLFVEIFNGNTDPNVSGWAFIFSPIIIGLFVLSCFPDFICLVFSFLYYKSDKIVFLILEIISALIAIVIMSFLFMSNPIMVCLCDFIKVIIIISCILSITFSKKQKND